MESINELASRPSGTGGISEEEREKIDKSVSNVEATEMYNTIKISKNDGTYQNVVIKIKGSENKNDILNVFKTSQQEGSFTTVEGGNTFVIEGFDETKDLTLIYNNLFLIADEDYQLDKSSGTVVLKFDLEETDTIHYIVTSTSYSYGDLKGTPNLEVYALDENLTSLIEGLESRGQLTSAVEVDSNVDTIVSNGYYTGMQGLPSEMTEGKVAVLSVIGTGTNVIQKCFVVDTVEKNVTEYNRVKTDTWGEWQKNKSEGTTAKQIELQKGETHIEWKYTDELKWKQLVSIEELKGADGREIELRRGEEAIQYKYKGESDSSWKNVVRLEYIKGDKGEPADTSQFYTKDEVDGKTQALASKSHTHNKTDILDFIHKHPKSEIVDFPTSLPANGGNADTVANLAPKETYQNGKYIPVVKSGVVEVGTHIDFHTTQDSKDYEGRISYSNGDLMWQNEGGTKNVNITEEIRNLKQGTGGLIKSIQKGVRRGSQGEPTITIPISTIDPNKSIVLLDGNYNINDTIDKPTLPVLSSLQTNNIVLTSSRANYIEGKDSLFSWQIIEFK